MKAATTAPVMVMPKGKISIHAAREGGDCGKLGREPLVLISIHAAREGGDAPAWLNASTSITFQSTPPVKAATTRSFMDNKKRSISIHAAREGGDDVDAVGIFGFAISIHAAREGGDLSSLICFVMSSFQSTPPVKAATLQATPHTRISVFQSTPPVKAATFSALRTKTRRKFQSTPPVKAATELGLAYDFDEEISIHAAREGGDKQHPCGLSTASYFNPRRP